MLLLYGNDGDVTELTRIKKKKVRGDLVGRKEGRYAAVDGVERTTNPRHKKTKKKVLHDGTMETKSAMRRGVR